jgi:hypothetical protein
LYRPTQHTDFPSLLLTTRYLCLCCHTRVRSGGKGLSPCTSQEDCGMTPPPCSRTKVRADTASSASPTALRASARVASGNWEQSHSHTPTNTACPSVPTHLHSALSLFPSLLHLTLSLKHYLFSLSLVSCLYNTLFLSLLLLPCWCFVSLSH